MRLLLPFYEIGKMAEFSSWIARWSNCSPRKIVPSPPPKKAYKSVLRNDMTLMFPRQTP